eukprot:396485-Pelagomonas_calceolata.AAC.2
MFQGGEGPGQSGVNFIGKEANPRAHAIRLGHRQKQLDSIHRSCRRGRTPPVVFTVSLRRARFLYASLCPKHTKHTISSIDNGRKVGVWRCPGWLRGCLAPNMAAKGVFWNLRQNASTPGLKLLSGRLSMLLCQILLGDTGEACQSGAHIRTVVQPDAGGGIASPMLQLSFRFFFSHGCSQITSIEYNSNGSDNRPVKI